MSGMDQFSDIPPWVSAISAAVSALFAGLSLCQSKGSKKAKAEAEKQAQQAEESLKQMQQIVAEQQSQSQSQSKIAASLQASEFKLTHVRGDATFSLRNVTMGPIEILDVVNSDQFMGLELENIVKEFQSGEKVEVTLRYSNEDDNLRLRIDGRDNILCVPIEYNLDLLLNR